MRIIAPLKARAVRLSERMQVSIRTARRAARDLDRRRIQFDRTMHRADATDPHNFDIVLDSDSLGLEIGRRPHRPRRGSRDARQAARRRAGAGGGASLVESRFPSRVETRFTEARPRLAIAARAIRLRA